MILRRENSQNESSSVFPASVYFHVLTDFFYHSVSPCLASAWFSWGIKKIDVGDDNDVLNDDKQAHIKKKTCGMPWCFHTGIPNLDDLDEGDKTLKSILPLLYFTLVKSHMKRREMRKLTEIFSLCLESLSSKMKQ